MKQVLGYAVLGIVFLGEWRLTLVLAACLAGIYLWFRFFDWAFD